MIEIAILPMAMDRAITRLLNIIVPIGGAPDVEMPEISTCL